MFTVPVEYSGSGIPIGDIEILPHNTGLDIVKLIRTEFHRPDLWKICMNHNYSKPIDKFNINTIKSTDIINPIFNTEFKNVFDAV